MKLTSKRVRIGIAMLAIPCMILLGFGRVYAAGPKPPEKSDIGIALIAAGLVLATQSMNNAVCPLSSGYQAVVAGMSMIAAGSALIISGSRDHKAPIGKVPGESDIIVPPRDPRKISFDAEPMKENWAVGARIKW